MRRQMGTLSCSTIPSRRGSKPAGIAHCGCISRANSARPFPEDTHPLQGGPGIVWKAQGVQKLLRRHITSPLTANELLMRLSLCAQHSAEGRLLCSPKTTPRAKGCACPAGRETWCPLPPHPSIPAPIHSPLVPTSAQIWGSPRLEQGGAVGTARAVPGQLDLSDLLQVALALVSINYPPHIQGNTKYKLQECLGPGGDAGNSHSKG